MLLSDVKRKVLKRNISKEKYTKSNLIPVGWKSYIFYNENSKVQ